MSIYVTNLAELDTDKVQQTLSLLTTLLSEDHPTLELQRGVLHDLVLYYGSVLHQARREEILRLQRSNSLAAIQADPSLADADTVDNVLSNFMLTRRQGAAAGGTVTILVSRLASVTIQSGAVFTAEGQTFRTTAAYVARTSAANVQSSTDRVLTPLADGSYSFTIEVTAAESGAAGMIVKDTLLVPSTPIVNFLRAYATSDFTGGVDTETNEELMLRQQEGLSARVLANRGTMNALLREAFPALVGSSIIGYGDAEQLRDKHSLWPGAAGGRVDWYVRTQQLPQRLALTKTASLVTKHSNGTSTWQLSLTRDDAPGFYDVVSIAPAALTSFLGTLTITQELRGVDLTQIAGELTPDILSALEGAYSRYQTATLQFLDTETDVSSLDVGATASYLVTVRVLPEIAAVQSLVSSRGVGYAAGDTLIRAAVPCFVSLAFTLQGRPGLPLPDAASLRTALAAYVNTLGFPGRLEASQLVDLIHDYLPEGMAISPLDMFGQIRRPNGSVRSLRSPSVLIIPSESASMVSARTVGFILDPANIIISAQATNVPEVY